MSLTCTPFALTQKLHYSIKHQQQTTTSVEADTMKTRHHIITGTAKATLRWHADGTWSRKMPDGKTMRLRRNSGDGTWQRWMVRTQTKRAGAHILITAKHAALCEDGYISANSVKLIDDAGDVIFCEIIPRLQHYDASGTGRFWTTPDENAIARAVSEIRECYPEYAAAPLQNNQ